MKITFFKSKNNKPNILTCTRSDGSITWSKIHPGLMIHDLIHYAVETTLEYKNAFYGLLAKGHNIEDFEAPRAKRSKELIPKNLPFEALHTEFLVGLFQMEIVDGQPYDDFNKILKEVYEEKSIQNYEPLKQTKIESIRLKINQLHQKWQLLKSDEKMDLFF